MGKNAKIIRKRPKMNKEYVPVFASVSVSFIVNLNPWNEKYTMINCVTMVPSPNKRPTRKPKVGLMNIPERARTRTRTTKKSPPKAAPIPWIQIYLKSGAFP